MQQEKVKRNAIAIAVSVGAHVALIALLFVLHLRAAPREEPEELILVNFGRSFRAGTTGNSIQSRFTNGTNSNAETARSQKAAGTGRI